jgi:hypothetical protein
MWAIDSSMLNITQAGKPNAYGVLSGFRGSKLLESVAPILVLHSSTGWHSGSGWHLHCRLARVKAPHIQECTRRQPSTKSRQHDG